MVTEEMVGHKFGEFSPTRTFYGHTSDRKAKRSPAGAGGGLRRTRKRSWARRARERDLPENEAKAVARMLRVSPQKLNLVAQLIRGKKVATALADLQFSQKRIAKDVKKCLESAIANAENNHDLDVDDLIVAEAHVGKALVIKRFHPRGRGRMGKILKPFANLTIVVRQVEAKRLKETAHGSEGQSDRSAARHQPHLGFALVRRQERVRHAAARGHEDPQGAR